MDFEFDADQLGLQTAVAEVLAKECPSSYLRSVIDGGHDPVDLWKRLCSLEWPGLALSADEGGSAATEVELAIVLEQLGYVGDPTPFLATTTQFAPVIAAAGSPEQRLRFLGKVATGESTGTLALAEASGIWNVDASPVHAHAFDGSWQLAGSGSYVLDGDRADEIVVLAHTDSGLQAFVVPAEAARVTRRPALDGALHITDVSFDGVVVDDDRRLTGDGVAAFTSGLELATTGLALVMVGACQRALDMVVEYARSREQFGVPIGSFQAVKHKAVDMYLAIERARAVAYFAAQAIAKGDPRRTVATSMAKAAAGDAQRLVFRDAIQLFGGLGFTWENDLQMYVRRAKAGELLLGGAAHHRLLLAHALLDGPIQPTEVLSGASGFDEETEAFRRDFLTWLDAHAPAPEEAQLRPSSTANLPDWAHAWQRTMFDAGWLVPGNSPEHGGRSASLLEQFVHLEELARRGIVASFNPQGVGIIAPSILTFGTEEQKTRWAVPILRGDLTAALGMSEPGAGSDLAGLRTRAVLKGDHFVVSGQKVWTSGAHDADVLLAFVRTDPDAPKHKGISVLIIPTDTPGITRRPFGSIVSREELDFNEVFFDDVVVPAENLLGELNGGWRVANGSLGHERAMLWLGESAHLQAFLDEAADLMAESPRLSDDDRVLDAYASVAIDAQALTLLGLRAVAKTLRNAPSTEQLILKLFGSEAVQHAIGEALEWLGPKALDHSVPITAHNHLQIDTYNGSWFDQYLRTFAITIAGGTSEIQRNIVAEKVLGLPR